MAKRHAGQMSFVLTMGTAEFVDECFGVILMQFKQYFAVLWQPFCDVTGTYPKGLSPMLRMLELAHVGRHHSGIG